MVKSVLGVYHPGLRDWIIQRVSAVFMAAYMVGLVLYVACHPGITFAVWHGLFACTAMKVATLLFVLLLLMHAWIGMWTVLTDYVKCFVLRSVLNVGIILSLVACFFWALLILWSV
ncbi:MAG TPA: succinate dehydrogenase, hydrophobic membrane anchor protein [Gammaproteobacteria bacterium]|jgi:succinate dehydrogenase / fumarate reductase membrane anchor subunit|nr:succinate dehydrogenase, hydrophobic membrane anchor protein [Gammaproteobacteria bacterium]